jgi:allophanate hydrolase subunit 1
LTPKVPAGALVLAVRQLVLFTNPSVTGWRQVAYTAFRPFKFDRADPFALRLGDGLRFHAVSHDDMHALDAGNTDGLGGARCEVLQ